MDITAKVICESEQGDILNQYITFSRVLMNSRSSIRGIERRSFKKQSESVRIKMC